MNRGIPNKINERICEEICTDRGGSLTANHYSCWCKAAESSGGVEEMQDCMSSCLALSEVAVA